MGTKKSSQKIKLLTEVELEIMNAVWSLGECTVKEVHTQLNEQREVAYTSVATIMKILEQKKVLVSQKKDKALIYSAAVSRSEYEATSLKHLQEKVFQGSPSSMVVRLLSEAEISPEELRSIRALLNERLKP